MPLHLYHCVCFSFAGWENCIHLRVVLSLWLDWRVLTLTQYSKHTLSRMLSFMHESCMYNVCIMPLEECDHRAAKNIYFINVCSKQFWWTFVDMKLLVHLNVKEFHLCFQSIISCLAIMLSYIYKKSYVKGI